MICLVFVAIRVNILRNHKPALPLEMGNVITLQLFII